MVIENEKIILPEPEFLSDLNNQQKEAVKDLGGPTLVLSGAGTGKTRVLTSRLANIIFSRKAKTSEILAVTFTNKAALEMKQRVEKLLNFSVDGMYLGTFHSIGVRILRKYSNFLGINNQFTILDKDDQLRLLKQVISILNLDSKDFVPKNFLYMIDQMKNLGLDHNEISNHEFEKQSKGKLSEIYKVYQKRLTDFNSVDYGDLLLLPLKLLRTNSEVLNFYQEKFKYILVDEYQDTNTVQYLFLRLLANLHQNICCVGDEDQSIYGWRGAQLRNILNFEKDFENSKIIRLEQNYRSTGNILETASSLISHNKERIGKKLWTSDSSGEMVEIINLENDEMEAAFIAQNIIEYKKKGLSLSKLAILTRASFQFKDIEDRFIKENIKYKVVGGLKFYERKEVKDALAYFKILINPLDNLSLERILNVPKRSIGKALLSKLYKKVNEDGISLYDSLKISIEEGLFNKSTSLKIKKLLVIFEKHNDMLKKSDHSEVAGSLLEDVGYCEMLQKEKTPEAEGRLENLKKLIIDIKNRNSIFEFLEEVSLLTENLDDSSKSEKVSLMTLHSAKGLEFDHVFLPGWEEGIFPNQRSLNEGLEEKALEEERRLAYVGITRARKKLKISYVNFRKLYNYSVYRSVASRFLGELPRKNCKVNINKEIQPFKRGKLEYYNNEKFSIGDKVVHEEYGYGKVLEVQKKTLKIKFENEGLKKNIFCDFVEKVIDTS